MARSAACSTCSSLKGPSRAQLPCSKLGLCSRVFAQAYCSAAAASCSLQLSASWLTHCHCLPHEAFPVHCA